VHSAMPPPSPEEALRLLCNCNGPGGNGSSNKTPYIGARLTEPPLVAYPKHLLRTISMVREQEVGEPRELIHFTPAAVDEQGQTKAQAGTPCDMRNDFRMLQQPLPPLKFPRCSIHCQRLPARPGTSTADARLGCCSRKAALSMELGRSRD